MAERTHRWLDGERLRNGCNCSGCVADTDRTPRTAADPTWPDTNAGREMVMRHASPNPSMWLQTPGDVMRLVNRIEAEARREALATPPGTRLILANESLLDTFGTRTEDGYRMTAEWGDPRPEGWYEPMFTVHYDGDLRATARRDALAELRAKVAAEELGRYYVRVLALIDEAAK